MQDELAGRQSSRAKRKIGDFIKDAGQGQIVYPPRVGPERRHDVVGWVEDDIARKSPVIMEMTMSIGVRIACLVKIRPKPRNSTCRDL